MKISTALILSAGLGKRLNPLTLTTPKPLLELNNITILERCINIIIKLGAKKIFLNTFHLGNQIFKFIENKKFPIDIQIIKDGKEILNTGGGILNMVKHSEDKDFIIFNPDTLWNEYYIEEINKMQDLYFSKKLNNVLLLANKKLSFDQTFKGDFNLKNNLLNINENNDFIYIGCQILNKKILKNQNKSKFSILNIWNKLIDQKKLYGFESIQKFYHLTDLKTFNKLKDL